MAREHSPLDVVFDISMLQGIRANTFNRAGIFRVIDRLAHELARSQDCRVRFSCCDYHLDIDRVYGDVVTAYPELSHVPPVHLWRPKAELQSLAALNERIRAIRGRTFSAKVRRKVLRLRAARLMQRIEFDVSALPQHGVFHSPWEALPPLEHFAARGVRRALTIYDMTPVLLPQFFEGNEVFTAILRSIAPQDHILAISECTKRDFCEYTRHDPERVHVTPLAADPAMFRPVTDRAALQAIRQSYRIPDGPYLLSVNTLQPRKNLEHAIRSFCRLVRSERLSDLSLVLVGDRGWKTAEIEATLKATGDLASRIVVTGYVPDRDLAALYSGALAFVYVSHYEGFGLPPLEAMQCGVPVVAANNSSLPEVVGDAGLLVPTADGDALCAAMLSLYRDPALRERYAVRGLERARSFTWRRCADLTVAAYRRARDE